MAVKLRPRTAILLLVVVLTLGVVGSTAISMATDGPGYNYQADIVPIHQSTDGGLTELWPYTSTGTDFDQRTLAINVVIYGDPDITKWYLTELGTAQWNITEEDEQDLAPMEVTIDQNASVTPWRPADGADRYIYIRDRDGEGHWLSESYQLHSGDYLGTRHHIRAYTAPDEEQRWTAIQAHREHWDWFHLRHSVDSIEQSQSFVEQEFMGRDIVENLYRTYAGNDFGSDSDGWMTVIEFQGQEPPFANPVRSAILLVPIGLLGAVRLSRIPNIRTVTVEIIPVVVFRLAGLVIGLVGLFMFVRFGAVFVERWTDLPPKFIAVPFYLLILFGLPITAYLLARHLDRIQAFVGAALGFTVAILLDYTYLGVATLPLDVLVHRGALAVALGLIALGASYPVRREIGYENPIQMGVLLWLVAMFLPLMRYVPIFV